MPLILAFIGLIAPRFTALMLWFFSNWFTGVFDTKIWPILGFIFLPFTMLWYSAVVNWFNGEWSWWQVIVLLIAILSDLNSEKRAGRR